MIHYFIIFAMTLAVLCAVKWLLLSKVFTVVADLLYVRCLNSNFGQILANSIVAVAIFYKAQHSKSLNMTWYGTYGNFNANHVCRFLFL